MENPVYNLPKTFKFNSPFYQVTFEIENQSQILFSNVLMSKLLFLKSLKNETFPSSFFQQPKFPKFLSRVKIRLFFAVPW